MIDGNGHTISGLTEPLVKHGVAQNYIFKDLTIADSDIESGDGNGLGRGAFLACADGTCLSLTITNCKLLNSTVTSSFTGTGAFVGYVSDGQTLRIEGCTVEGCEISGTSSVGGILGFRQMSAGTSEVIDCTVKETTLSGSRVGAVAGRITATGTLTINNFTNGTAKNLVGNVVGSTAKVVVDGVEQA